MPKQRPGLPDPSDELLELVERVDTMMNTDAPIADRSKVVSIPDSKDAPLKINLKPLEEQTSAPDLPVDLAKKILGNDADQPAPAKTVKPKPEQPAKPVVTADDPTKAALVEPPIPPTPKPKKAVKPKVETPLAPVAEPEPPVNTESELPEEAVMEPEATPAAEEPPQPVTPELTPQAEGSDDNLADTETDKAVEDIVARESDTLLALEDAKNNRFQPPETVGLRDRLRNFLLDNKKWLVPLIFVLIVFGLPQTRYKILGLFIKEPVNITVIDGKTNTPVSNVAVQLAGMTVKTDANGVARMSAPVGPQTIAITKQYYRNIDSPYFVGLKGERQISISLSATGRLVPITILNRITNKPVAGAEIKVLNTTAKTNAQGQASVALPANAVSDTIVVSLAGKYNNLNATLQVTDTVVKANTFYLTPSGHVYFLSNAGGSLDVVKTDLDGSERKTVLAGSGHEDPRTTSLLASRDWRYLVLKARRDGGHAALYLIDTNGDKVTEFDDSDADFNLIGWYNHAFMYQLTRTGQPSWQPASEAVKSYDADNLQLNQLDQNQAEGTSPAYAYQHFSNFYIVNNALIYNTQWYSYGETANDLGSKTDAIRGVQPNGQNKKDYQTFPAATTASISASLYEPQGIYYAVADNTDNKTTYYAYEDQTVKSDDVDQASFTKQYPTYLVSPSGNKTFWSELRDGKQTLFTGDANAAGSKPATVLTGYDTYGWYGDDYLLASKKGSELYIVSAKDTAAGQPFKLTDYYKPVQTYPGYGYGYGGL